MILVRQSRFNIPKMKEGQGRQEQLRQNLIHGQSAEKFEAFMIKAAELMQLYNAALKEVSTKLEILDEECQLTHKHNPIHHLECRIKEMSSIANKAERYGLPFSAEAVRDKIYDIAGIRVICNFTDDIYTVEKMLLGQSDVTLIQRKDYIAEPKASGYRSLHLVVSVPVFLSDRTEKVPVEIQLRTTAMDYWASLEHMLKYKNNASDIEKYSEMLVKCADTLAETEKTMRYIHENIER